MSSHAQLPPSLSAQRILLWVIAVILGLNAAAALAEAGGGFFGLGYALPYILVGVLSGLLAVRVPRGERWVRVTITTVYVVTLLGEIARLSQGDARAIIGVLFPIVGLVLILRRSAQQFFGAPQPSKASGKGGAG